MSKVDTIISELQAIAANPRKAMEDYKAATGKGAVGVWFPFTHLTNSFMLQVVYLSDAGADSSKYLKHVLIFLHSHVQSCSQ